MRRINHLIKSGWVVVMFSLTVTLKPSPVQAIVNPTEVPNNKFGIHVADVGKLDEVAKLVNSSGGDWGYVTVVIQDKDRDSKKWQRVFNQMRRLHLIPIVRLATHGEGGVWVKPKEEDIDEWVRFLANLNWPVMNRYVVVFNEPNHAREWGNALDPEGYGDFLVKIAKALKETSTDFFILPAGLDFSASSNGDSLEAVWFLSRMIKTRPEVLEVIDGWTSHSYPNPGFSGSPYASGRGSLKSYLWELAYLKRLGLNRDLPVFITETGWMHHQGQDEDSSLLSPTQVAANYQVALATVWTDPKIVAVTPFIFDYQDYPFDRFSWKVPSAQSYYPQYEIYRTAKKVAGVPRQIHQFRLTSPIIPKALFSGSRVELKTSLRNLGQSILDFSAGYELVVKTQDNGMVITTQPSLVLEPGQTGRFKVSLQVPELIGKLSYVLKLKYYNEEILLEEGEVDVLTPPSLVVKTPLGLGLTQRAQNASLKIYDNENRLVQQFVYLQINQARLTVTGLNTVVPGLAYRLVVKVPYYLPQQKVVVLSLGENRVTLPRLLPLDLNNDGKVNFADLGTLTRLKPGKVLDIFVGGGND